MSKNVLILGAGGMAREVYQIYRDAGRGDEVEGFMVSKERNVINKLPKKVLFNANIPKNRLIVNGIGSPMRIEWIEKIEKSGVEFDSIVHPTAILGNESILGKDLVVCANSVLSCNLRVGNHIIINMNSTIAHDCEIQDYVTVSPGVNIGGRVTIGKASFIGIGTTIIQGVTIGSGVFIGAGSVVVDDIPDNSLVYGNPARVIKKISRKDWDKLI